MSSQERVRLSNDWRGYRKGEAIMVNKIVAHALVEQGIGIYANPKKPIKIMKNVKDAPRDKMVKYAPKMK